MEDNLTITKDELRQLKVLHPIFNPDRAEAIVAQYMPGLTSRTIVALAYALWNEVSAA